MSSETVKTLEIGYIYKWEPFRAGFTAFYSRLDDLIIQKGSPLYKNIAGAETKGAEIELTWKITPFLILDANLSYSDAEDRDTGEDIGATGRWVGNAGIVYMPVGIIPCRFNIAIWTSTSDLSLILLTEKGDMTLLTLQAA